MNVLRYSDPSFEDALGEMVGKSSLFDATIEERTAHILDEVQARGDEALVEFSERFDHVSLSPGQLAVTKAELVTAATTVTADFRKAVADARKNVETFARKSLRRDWSMKNSHGGRTGEKFDAFDRVGLYVPGGTAPLVSTALMTIGLAKVAGCREIVVCTPAGKSRGINPALLFGIQAAGATEIYRLGGAQAIAAMGCGTQTIARAQKIFGPGNAYVVAAKRLLFGHVSVDLLPGPSEVLVLADDSADPAWVAADLLAQAEHGSGHERVWLVTPSAKLLRAVEKAVGRQLKDRQRKHFIETTLQQNGWLIQVRGMEEGIALANRLAPEHCEIMTRKAKAVSRRIRTAGAIFVGPYSPTVLGDYVAGPSHVLPTGGAGLSFAGLTVDQFQRRTSVVEYGKAALKTALPSVRQFALLEGLDAHGYSASVRLERSVQR